MQFLRNSLRLLITSVAASQPAITLRSPFIKPDSNTKMAPIPESKSREWTAKVIESSPVFMFSKTTCPYCIRLKQSLKAAGVKFGFVDINERANCSTVQETLKSFSGSTTVPQLFVHGQYVGGCDKSLEALSSRELFTKIETRKYDYDLIVIGGGSGGLAASKEAVEYGAKVAVLDFVEPTPTGTSWGLGGTCVNVGCIPKKLMHQAAMHSHNLDDASSYGWQVDKSKINHDWITMTENVSNHIRSLNFGYRTSLRNKGVDYLNEYGKLVDAHKVQCTNKQGQTRELSAKYIVLATGERPRYPGVPGDKDCCITSDDLFWLPYNPGKTLVVGASYVALECAGFLAALGNDVTVMVRSILLRGFDQDMANRVGAYMESHGVKFVRECVPTQFTQVKPVPQDKSAPGQVKVKAQFVKNGSVYEETFDTVLLAIGRDPCTANLNLEAVKMQLDNAGRVVCDEEEKTSVSNIFAIGDIVSGKLQLTPVAIAAGRNLVNRLFNGSQTLTNYSNVPTTVFTPLEYGAIGLAEEDAIKKYGADDIEVYHSSFKPLEWTVSHREDNACYAKLICVKSQNEKVVGFHYLGPNAGEVTQGFAIALLMGATKASFDEIIGIHPTAAEVFTTLEVTKASGQSSQATGC